MAVVAAPALPSSSTCDGTAARVIVFAARRTGSSFLVNLLRTHPDVLMHGELFHVRDIHDASDGYHGHELPHEDVFEVRRRSPLGMLHHVQCHTEGRRAVGLKVFRDHLSPRNWQKLWSWCTVCVVLRREDVRAQYGSLLRARATGRWKGRTDRRLLANVSFDAVGYQGWWRNQQHWYSAVSDGLARRGSNVTVVPLSFERNLVGEGGPDLTPLWRALRLTPPRGSSARRRNSG